MIWFLSLALSLIAPASEASELRPGPGGNSSAKTLAISTNAVLSGSVLTSSGSVIIVSTTPDAGHDTLSVRAQDNSSVFTVESLTSGTGKVGIGTNSPSTKMHMSSGTLLIDGSGSDVQFPAGVIGTSEIADSAVDTGKINTDAVDTAKIRSDSITTAKLADGSVNTAKIASDAVTTVKILNANITAEKLVNAGVFTGDATTTFPALTIGNGAITAAKMVNSGVFTGDATTTFPALTIGALAIDTGKIASGAVDTTKILDGAVSTHKLLDTDHKVASLAVGYPVTGNNQLLVLGRVGIGTASPGAPLDVRGATHLKFNTDTNDTLIYGGDPRLILTATSAVSGLKIIAGSQPLNISTNAGGGDIVVNGSLETTIQAIRATAAQTTQSTPAILFSPKNWSGSASVTNFQGSIYGKQTLAASPWGGLSLGGGASADHLFIRSDGNVGIGNTNPNLALVVTGAGHFTSSMTVAANLLMQNNQDINFKDTGGAERQILSLTSSDIVQVGDIAGGYELDFHSGAKYATLTSNGLWTVPPAAEAIASGGVITANACGGLKRISSASAVTTDTTNTFTAPAAGNAGCCMDVVNVNAADAITLDNNALFKSAGAADVVLGTGDTVRVCSSGASGAWYQIGATGNN